MKKKSFELFESIMLSMIKYFKWFVIAAVVLIALTGIFKVDSNEVAVVLRFGKLVGSTRDAQVKKPGLHFALPNIIDEVIKIPVETVQEVAVTTHYGNGMSIGPDVKNNGYVITGDSNIVLIKTMVKYKISNPVQYALYFGDIIGTVNGVVSGELNSIICSMDIDDVLTSEKAAISSEIKKSIQACLDAIDIGVLVTNVELTDITPPKETKEAFDNVITASVKKQTLIQEANDYRASAIPQAEAQADDMIGSANINQSTAISKANAEVAEFYGLYKQYKLNPDVIYNGVFRERTSSVMAMMGATVIVPDGNSSAKIILP